MRSARLALRVASVALRACAWALLALVAADSVLGAGARTWLLGINGMVSRMVPSALAGLFVLQTPFGGAFRGDFALFAVMLFAAGWLLGRASALLR